MIGVIGATGNTGRAVVAALKAKGADFKCLVRDPAKAAETLGSDIEVVAADLADAASIETGLAGCDKLFLLSGHSPVMAEQLTGAIAAAKAAGVKHVVKLSGAPSTARADSESLVGRGHYEVDEALKASGLDWTLLQPGFFMQNLLNTVPMVKGMGKIMMPLPADLPIAMIDVRDTGDVAAAVLTSDGHEGQAYYLAGPQTSMAAAAAALSGTVGKDVAFAEVPLEGAVGAMKERGMPDWLVDHQTAMMKLCASGGMADTSGEIERLSGQAPRTIDDFARDFAGAFKD